MSNQIAVHDVFDKLLEESDQRDVPRQPSGRGEADAESATNAAKVEDSVETDSSDTDDAANTADRAETSGRRRWLLRIAAGIAASLFVAVSAAAGYFGWQVTQQNDIAAAGQAATAAATTYAVTLTTVDYQKLDQNFAQVIEGATGEFKNMYSQSSAQLRQLLIDNKAISHGTVIDSAIKSVSKDTVDVLIFVDQSITNSVNPQPRIDRSRISMTMQRVDDRWLASTVDIK